MGGGKGSYRASSGHALKLNMCFYFAAVGTNVAGFMLCTINENWAGRWSFVLLVMLVKMAWVLPR